MENREIKLQEHEKKISSAGAYSNGLKDATDLYSSYLFVYFTGNESSQEKLYYGVSIDGYNFYALNKGKPVYSSSLGTGCLRDPFIFKGEDGYYYILATDMQSSQGYFSNYAIIILKTLDFIHIIDSTRIDYHCFNSTKKCNRAWAPQAIWCPEKKSYMIYLTIHNEDSEIGTVMWRHYATDLLDASTYTEPELMMKALGDDNTAIDGDIIYDSVNNRFIMYYDGRRIAVADSLSGEFSGLDPQVSQEYDEVPFTTQDGEKMLVEGSNIYKILGEERWIIAADGTSFNGGQYALAETSDFIQYRQLKSEEYSFDFVPRHGYVIPITEGQLQKLFEQYGTIDFKKR
jgi:Glycosyl hydrolases family 43.